jgi:hypothetical protein
MTLGSDVTSFSNENPSIIYFFLVAYLEQYTMHSF